MTHGFNYYILQLQANIHEFTDNRIQYINNFLHIFHSLEIHFVDLVNNKIHDDQQIYDETTVFYTTHIYYKQYDSSDSNHDFYLQYLQLKNQSRGHFEDTNSVR